MQLKEGRSLWMGLAQQSGEIPLGRTRGHGPLVDSTQCEVAIIGSGITGALVAEHLIRQGVDVVTVDRRDVCQGSTGASTGLIQYELDTTLLELIDKRGQSEAMAAYRLCAAVLKDFPAYLESIGVMCDMQKNDSIFLAASADEIPTFELEVQARQACGIDVRFLTSGELQNRYAIARPAAICSPGAMVIDPYDVAGKLWDTAIHAGLRLHTPTQINGYDADDSGVTLHTDTGVQLRAKKVVFATGYETPTFLNVDTKISTTYALVSQMVVERPGTRPDCLVWESARPYLYVRTGPQNRLIVGGEDEPWLGRPLSPEKRKQKIDTLLAKMNKLYPQLEIEPEYEWSGLFAHTTDGLPYIGQSPKFPRGFFALGYGGNGILFSYLAARIITDLFTGAPNDHVKLFRFDR